MRPQFMTVPDHSGSDYAYEMETTATLTSVHTYGFHGDMMRVCCRERNVDKWEVPLLFATSQYD